MATTLIVGDLHCPFQHPKAFSFLKKIRDKYKPNQVISLGDEVDFHSCSFHEHDPELYSAGQELLEIRAELAKLHKIFPKLTLCESNHGSLLERKLKTAGLPASILKDKAELYETPGWVWKAEVQFKSGSKTVVCRHDFGSDPRQVVNKVAPFCTVWGHRHTSAGIAYRHTGHDLTWAMNAGCIIDPNHRAFSYAKGTLDRPVLGCALIIDGNPLFIPLEA